MQHNISIVVPPNIGLDLQNLIHFLQEKYLGGKVDFIIEKRSIDARQRQIKVNLKLQVFIDEEKPSLTFDFDYKNVKNSPEIVIVGAGPAGLFAALEALELGLKPIVLERGKTVRARRRDLAAINKKHIVNPESNYCFGEGGAGTYSDGKLYTRSKKRGDVTKILQQLVQHGATEEILYDAHPHIGTNKLPKIIENIRNNILQHGGEIHFNTRVDDLILDGDAIKGVITNKGDKVYGKAVVLATGHSARDIFYLLHKKAIEIEAKPFALGVRVEHSQQFIDSRQYHCKERGAYLPAAVYALKYQSEWNRKTRGVFSFCMCPGGFIVPAATAEGEVVVNGMSPSRRDSKYANSGIVVSIDLADLASDQYGVFAGLELQKAIEQMAFRAGGETQTAPAQLLDDFVNGKTSDKLLATSYQPGITSAPLHELLPENIAIRLQQAFTFFNKKIPGFLTNEAQILGVESRTSAPIKIPRDPETLQHIRIKNLYPCAEGAGYAGGIMSAAIDGQRCVRKILYN